MPTTDITLDEDGQESFNRREFIGNRCLALAWDGPWSALETVEGDDRESAARDAVSDILTALFGVPGFFVPTKAEDHVATEWSEVELNERKEIAQTFLDMAFDSWTGDAEDYTAEIPDNVTW